MKHQTGGLGGEVVLW